mmetsp:Transcript_111367/g.228060  ORF Transcript_111367/g.228060 Transcript_111367/m.228060 type:complete len:997 (+) Transcript_111367:121-3111(+)
MHSATKRLQPQPLLLLLLLCGVIDVDVVDGLPSFGTKIPNGDKVPCPSHLSEEDANGCTASGFCFGLGHPGCGGFSPEDRIKGNNNGENENPSTIVLGSFGDDWRSNGFLWTKELCELDSDRDGFTNGEELGDPCCVWTTQASSGGAMLDGAEGFVPSHPGMKEDTPPIGFVYDKTVLCAASVVDATTVGDTTGGDETTTEGLEEADGTTTTDADDSDYEKHYNPGETRGHFEMRIEPYPIPIETTTYIDFAFNIPEDAPDLFHVVKGSAIVDQPKHLHHFVLFGCSERIDPSEEGLPLEYSPDHCQSMMLGGWAPGSDLFGIQSLDTGVLLGRAMGVEAFLLNIHYTDGVYADAASETHVMATDGIRIDYTTDFRPYSGLKKNAIFIPFASKQMIIPPNESRYFVSKTCNVNTACKDAGDEQLQAVTRFFGIGGDDESGTGADDLSCASIRAFCYLGGEFGSGVQRLCPVTCGLCGGGDDDDGQRNPRDPGSYRISSVNYHAHLLGREMYATLLREKDDDDDQLPIAEQGVSVIQKQAAGSGPTVVSQQSNSNNAPLSSRMIAKDLKSREIWHYDDQATIAMDFDIAGGSNQGSDAATTTKMTRGVEVKPGDKIHSTCVYDSTGRTEDTRFGLSTYDEMCIISFFVTFETPQSLYAANNTESGEGGAAGAAVDIQTDLYLRTFSCDPDEEFGTTDVYQGFLNETEDGRNIWFEHPIEDSDMCIFPVLDFVIVDTVLSRDTRNCPAKDNNEEAESAICRGFSSSGEAELVENAIAGYTCRDGTFDQQDSNEGITEKDCLEVGGGSAYEAYTCTEVEFWLVYESELVDGLGSEMTEYLRTDWWQPNCCRHATPKPDICDGISSTNDVEFMENAIAGYSCVGGTFDQEDSNNGVTEEDCLEVGGGSSYEAYSCVDVEYWMQHEALSVEGITIEVIEYLRTDWYQPRCCRRDTENGEPTKEGGNNTTVGSLSSTGSHVFSIHGQFLAFLAAITIIGVMI